jgi:hypothetical protein
MKKALRDVLPALSTTDVLNRSGVDTKRSRECGQRAASREVCLTDPAHVAFSQDGVRSVTTQRHQSGLHGMLRVGFWCRVFEILWAIVGPLPVLVIHLMVRWTRTNKRGSYEAMGKISAHRPVFRVQSILHVPGTVDSRTQEAPAAQALMARPSVTDVSRVTPNSATRTHIVKTFVADDGAPLFAFHDPQFYCTDLRLQRSFA